MSERSPAKARRRGAVKAPAKTLPATALSEENARLKAELAAAHQRIAELETRQSEVVNRIDWVIDSLHNLPD